MGFWVYILECTDGSYYVGHTDDLEARLGQHFLGTTGGYTAKHGFEQLAYATEFPTRDEAINRERQVKGWSRAKKEALIRGDWDRVRVLARSRTPMGK